MQERKTTASEIKSFARSVKGHLETATDKIEFAGSIRRGTPQRKEIDLICLPVRVAIHDLFGNATEWKHSEQWGQKLKELGEVTKKGQRYTQVRTDNDFLIDIFTPNPEDYCRQLAIRTGSNNFVKFVIARAWRARGWCGTKDGLRRMEDCKEVKKDGRTDYWKVRSLNPTIPPEWQSEEEFFQFIGLDFIKPYLRECKDAREGKRMFNDLSNF